jgi:hypothetical protein
MYVCIIMTRETARRGGSVEFTLIVNIIFIISSASEYDEYKIDD